MSFELNNLTKELPKPITYIDDLMNILKNKKYINSCLTTNDTLSYFIGNTDDTIILFPDIIILIDKSDYKDLINYIHKILNNNYDICEICMENINGGCIYICEQCTKFTCCKCTASMKQVSDICDCCKTPIECPSTQFMINIFKCPYCRYNINYNLKLIKLSNAPNVLEISIINTFAEKFKKVMNELLYNNYKNLKYPEVIRFNHPHIYCEKDINGKSITECGEDICNSPYVKLDGYHDHDHLENPDDIVAPNEFIIYIDYPLNNKIFKEIELDYPITRIELANMICELYQKIYKDEEESIQIQPIVPIEERTGLINRNDTDDIYGIWGHDIGDLLLVEVKKIGHNEDGIPIYGLSVDS